MTDQDTYISIQSEVKVSLKILEPSDPEKLAASFRRRSGSIGLCSELEFNRDRLAPIVRKIDKEHPDISVWLGCMQETMETMAEQLSELQYGNHKGELLRVSVSAVGIELPCSENCKEHDQIELVMELLPSSMRIMVIGKITEILQPDPAETKRIRVEFEHIRESDQEILIRHIHRVQLAELRNAREKEKKRV